MKELIKDRIDILVEKAKGGDFESQFELAKSFYYGKLVERSLPLARYWAFKAITNPDKDRDSDIYNLYQSANAPHFTDNERYVSFGTSYDISLTGSSLLGSTKFRGKFDIYPDDKKYYRTYYVTRFIILYIIRSKCQYGTVIILIHRRCAAYAPELKRKAPFPRPGRAV